jgi:DegV family protein with EDD domain
VRDLLLAGEDADSIVEQMKSYKTALLFVLESLNNFANNGRVSKVAAATVGVLGIRVVGRASEEGTLEVLSKCRGLPKALNALIDYMKAHHEHGKKVHISHAFNPEAAEKLAEKIREHFPLAEILIRECRGLCSFYAEKGGMLVGFEV